MSWSKYGSPVDFTLAEDHIITGSLAIDNALKLDSNIITTVTNQSLILQTDKLILKPYGNSNPNQGILDVQDKDGTSVFAVNPSTQAVTLNGSFNAGSIGVAALDLDNIDIDGNVIKIDNAGRSDGTVDNRIQIEQLLVKIGSGFADSPQPDLFTVEKSDGTDILNIDSTTTPPTMTVGADMPITGDITLTGDIIVTGNFKDHITIDNGKWIKSGTYANTYLRFEGANLKSRIGVGTAYFGWLGSSGAEVMRLNNSGQLSKGDNNTYLKFGDDAAGSEHMVFRLNAISGNLIVDSTTSDTITGSLFRIHDHDDNVQFWVDTQGSATFLARNGQTRYAGIRIGNDPYNHNAAGNTMKAGIFNVGSQAQANAGYDGNFYLCARNVNTANGSYIQLGQRNTVDTNYKGVIVIRAGHTGQYQNKGDILMNFGGNHSDTGIEGWADNNFASATRSQFHLDGQTGRAALFNKNTHSAPQNISPEAGLHIVANEADVFMLERNGGSYPSKFKFSVAANALTIRDMDTSAYILHADTTSVEPKLGIGTTSPNNTLHLKSSTTSAVGITMQGNTSMAGVISANNTAFLIRGDTSTPIHFDTHGSNTRMVIDTAGIVGIGTTTPSILKTDPDGVTQGNNKLHIRGASANAVIQCTGNTGADWIASATQGNRVSFGISNPTYGARILIQHANAGLSLYDNSDMDATSPTGKFALLREADSRLFSASTTNYLRFYDSTSDSGNVSVSNFTTSGLGDHGAIIGTNSGTLLVANKDAGNIQFATTDTTRMLIHSGGGLRTAAGNGIVIGDTSAGTGATNQLRIYNAADPSSDTVAGIELHGVYNNNADSKLFLTSGGSNAQLKTTSTSGNAFILNIKRHGVMFQEDSSTFYARMYGSVSSKGYGLALGRVGYTQNTPIDGLRVEGSVAIGDASFPEDYKVKFNLSDNTQLDSGSDDLGVFSSMVINANQAVTNGSTGGGVKYGLRINQSGDFDNNNPTRVVGLYIPPYTDGANDLYLGKGTNISAHFAEGLRIGDGSSITLTGVTVTNNSYDVAHDTATVQVGAVVKGATIPVGAVVRSITSDTAFKLNLKATGDSSANLTVWGKETGARQYRFGGIQLFGDSTLVTDGSGEKSENIIFVGNLGISGNPTTNIGGLTVGGGNTSNPFGGIHFQETGLTGKVDINIKTKPSSSVETAAYIKYDGAFGIGMKNNTVTAQKLLINSTDSQILSIRRNDGNNQWNFGLSTSGDLVFRERTDDAGSGANHATWMKTTGVLSLNKSLGIGDTNGTSRLTVGQPSSETYSPVTISDKVYDYQIGNGGSGASRVAAFDNIQTLDTAGGDGWEPNQTSVVVNQYSTTGRGTGVVAHVTTDSNGQPTAFVPNSTLKGSGYADNDTVTFQDPGSTNKLCTVKVNGVTAGANRLHLWKDASSAYFDNISGAGYKSIIFRDIRTSAVADTTEMMNLTTTSGIPIIKLGYGTNNSEVHIGSSSGAGAAYVGVGTQADYSANFVDNAVVAINTVALQGDGGGQLLVRKHTGTSGYGNILANKIQALGGFRLQGTGSYITISGNGDTDIDFEKPDETTVMRLETDNSKLIFTDTTAGDGQGDRSTILSFRGTQSGAEVSDLGEIKVSHSGTDDDTKGMLQAYLNNGTSLTQAMYIGNAITGDAVTSNFLGLAAGAGMPDYSVAIGHEALKTHTGAANSVAVGYKAMLNNDSGARNIAIGSNALTGETTASNTSDNIAIGNNAAKELNGAQGSVFIGSGAGENMTSGDYNVVIGHYKDQESSMTTGEGNTFIGKYSGSNQSSGTHNTFLGNQSGASDATKYGSSLWSTGHYNTGLGSWALKNLNGAANGNTAVGYSAGSNIGTNSYCTVIGHDADVDQAIAQTTWNGQVKIGAFGGFQAYSNLLTMNNFTSVSDNDTATEPLIKIPRYGFLKRITCTVVTASGDTGEYNISLGSDPAENPGDSVADRKELIGADVQAAELVGAKLRQSTATADGNTKLNIVTAKYVHIWEADQSVDDSAGWTLMEGQDMYVYVCHANGSNANASPNTQLRITVEYFGEIT